MRKTVWVAMAVILLMIGGCYSRKAQQAQTPGIEGQTVYQEILPSQTLSWTTEPTGTPTPLEPTGTPTPLVTEETEEQPCFTLAWTGDTQTMIKNYDKMYPAFIAMCEYVADQAESMNIVAFLHSGDMVDSYGSKLQWERFCEGVRRIGSKMPLFLVAGNHDYYNNQERSYWKDQFFVQEYPQEENFRNCEAQYMVLTLGDRQLLLVGICYREENNNEVLDWTRDVCLRFVQTPAILVVHGYLSNQGQLMHLAERVEQEVVAQCPNIRLILSGHSRGVSRQTFLYDDDGDGEADRTVNAIMSDLQMGMESYGYFNLLTFDPAANTLSVDSYSPFFDDHIWDDAHPELEQFMIEDVF